MVGFLLLDLMFLCMLMEVIVVCCGVLFVVVFKDKMGVFFCSVGDVGYVFFWKKNFGGGKWKKSFGF